jgi:hypothetical protein
MSFTFSQIKLKVWESIMSDNDDIVTSTLAETENYLVWTAEEGDGETTFHLELGQLTLHFFEDEWEEFLSLMQGVLKG